MKRVSISTLAGAARELTTAVMVNPYDSRGMAHAIQQAFNMPLAERRERHQAMIDVLRKNSITAWHTSFVDALDSSTVIVNASTRFADGGELGLGAEIGISTTRLHAYGPMGAEELTTTKFVVLGNGQVRGGVL